MEHSPKPSASDVSKDSPRPPHAPGPASGGASIAAPLTAEPGGLPARAFVGANSRPLDPDDLGLFPVQPIGPGETIPVRVCFPGGTAGDLVVVQAEDGGKIDGLSPVSRQYLDADREVRFSFTSTAEGGIYRITLRNGFDEKRLQFFSPTDAHKTRQAQTQSQSQK